MAVRFRHDQTNNSFYFITFTCFNWLPLFQKTNAYDAVHKWFDYLYKNNIYTTGYVIMPNHLHVLLYFPQMPKSLNTIIANAKRFIAYEMIKRLEGAKEEKLLALLRNGVKEREKKKRQVHKVFEESFDAKQCYSKDFLFEKPGYIHHNPVRKKWSLVSEFCGL